MAVDELGRAATLDVTRVKRLGLYLVIDKLLGFGVDTFGAVLEAAT